MSSIDIGKLNLSAGDGGLRVRLGDADALLSPMDVSRLEEFLKNYAPHERRIGFRVPLATIPADTRERFQVLLADGRMPVPLLPIDLSLTGALVQLPDQVEPDPVCRVQLSYGQDQCELLASVVRRQGDLCALHFLDALRSGELDPPEALLSIFSHLEQAWLQSRIAAKH